MEISFNPNQNTTKQVSVKNIDFQKITGKSVFRTEYGPQEKPEVTVDLSEENIQKIEAEIQSGLKDKIPGYLVMTDTGRTMAIASEIAKIKDPAERQKKIDEYVACVANE